MDFIDLAGDSGVAYRFRIWPEAHSHLPIAGNFVVVRRGPSPEVLAVGMTNDLSHARGRLTAGAESLVYTRLNVARATREAEHADLVARYPTARVVVS